MTDFKNTKALIDQWVADGTMPGASVLVQQRGERLFEYAGGLARLEPHVPATVDGLWAVASISKPVTTSALMQQVEARRVSLEQPVVELLPEFGPGKEKVLVRHLLTHSSGLSDRWGDVQIKSIDDLVAHLGRQKLAYEPGTACQYTNAGMELVSAIVQRLSGLDWDAYTKRHIFEPLDMTHSAFRPNKAELQEVALAYDMKGGTDNWANDLKLTALASAGGGLHSTLRDLAAFGQSFLDGGRPILSSDSVEQMTRVQTPGLKNLEGYAQTWGLGWYINRDKRPNSVPLLLSPSTFMHGGGTQTWLAVDPERDLVIVQLGNRVELPFEQSLKMNADVARVVLEDLDESL